MRAILWISYPEGKGFFQSEGCDEGDDCEIYCYKAKKLFEELFWVVSVGVLFTFPVFLFL